MLEKLQNRDIIEPVDSSRLWNNDDRDTPVLSYS